MTLLELLIKKLPQCAGWPKDAARCIYHEHKEGATFYDAEGDMVKNGLGFIDLCIPDVRREEVTREQYESAIAASKPEWDGEGLPPVGMEIEYKFTKVNYRTDFSRGKVLAYGMHNVFMEHWSSKNEFIQPFDKIEFRPIRSEADKKRDGIISMIEKAYKDCPHSDAVPQAIYEAIAEHIRID